MEDRKKRLIAALEAAEARSREEQTTTGNVGAFPVPLGVPQRALFPDYPPSKRKKKRKKKDESLFRQAQLQLERLRRG